jgi:hypothetical protein
MYEKLKSFIIAVVSLIAAAFATIFILKRKSKSHESKAHSASAAADEHAKIAETKIEEAVTHQMQADREHEKVKRASKRKPTGSVDDAIKKARKGRTV